MPLGPLMSLRSFANSSSATKEPTPLLGIAEHGGFTPVTLRFVTSVVPLPWIAPPSQRSGTDALTA